MLFDNPKTLLILSIGVLCLFWGGLTGFLRLLRVQKVDFWLDG